MASAHVLSCVSSTKGTHSRLQSFRKDFHVILNAAAVCADNSALSLALSSVALLQLHLC
jgi:hypothetical protein